MKRRGTFQFEYVAHDRDGNVVHFNLREPVGNQAWRYAWERAEKMCAEKGWIDLKAK